uniref:Cartilage acidic protein 1 n=1 Tax=Nothobranchius furzeri TaxID=105023 RepID=A0A8C6P4Z8_NOTFU
AELNFLHVRMLLCLLLFLSAHSLAQRSEPMFSAITKSVLPPDYDNNPTQLNYGMAVTDVDGDGDLEIFVAGYNGPNLVLKYDKQKKRLVNIAVDDRGSPFYALRDRQGNAIGVTACDIDGDGREEIYVLNTNNAFSGRATYSDKLFKFRNGRFEDLLNDDINEHRDVANPMAGRSVACVDRKGTGRYAIYIANYASGSVGPHALIEMDEAASDLSQGVVALSNVAEQAGLNKINVVSTNECVCFYHQDIASQKFSMPSPVRTVITADFDNDNELEVFFNNIAYRGPSANRLFRVSRREHGDPQIEELNIGEAAELEGRGTGAVAADFDGDGHLELVISHGESAAQPLSIYKVNQGLSNSWLRVIPRTKNGAFARGAKVVVYTKKSGPHTRIIDGGSGYLCEMEPVAHFGLGKDVATNVEVYWPDGRSIARPLEPSEINSVLEIHYPRDEEEVTPTVEIECGHGFALNENGRCTDKDECTQFPSVCPSDRPVCTNTYGSYKCRAKRRCNQGFEPNDDGSACVAGTMEFGRCLKKYQIQYSSLHRCVAFLYLSVLHSTAFHVRHAYETQHGRL